MTETWNEFELVQGSIALSRHCQGILFVLFRHNKSCDILYRFPNVLIDFDDVGILCPHHIIYSSRVNGRDQSVAILNTYRGNPRQLEWLVSVLRPVNESSSKVKSFSVLFTPHQINHRLGIYPQWVKWKPRNLSLRIVIRRSDNYHSVESNSLELTDMLSATASICNDEKIEPIQSNAGN